MKEISKLIVQNFKRFERIELDFRSGINVLIGDNEAGKSTLLLAIDLVLSGSRNKVEALGLNNIFNYTAVQKFLSGSRKVSELPILTIELYFPEQNIETLNGRQNTLHIPSDGLVLECSPDEELTEDIELVLSESPDNFPFEFYQVSFRTFKSEAYSGYRKFFRHVFIDNSSLGNDYAMRQYISDVYAGNVERPLAYRISNEYRRMKAAFKESSLASINEGMGEYGFVLKTDSKSSLEHDLTLTERSIPIEYKGKGKQAIVKTEFALNKKKGNLDIVLLEEPENHLSHPNMRLLIEGIQRNTGRQLFVTTHSNMICSRLNLTKLTILESASEKHMRLSSLKSDTAEFFMKAPNHSILDFILSRRVILVEGDAEYILLEKFFMAVTGQAIDFQKVTVISVGGTSFKRYLDVAKILNCKVAVIRDNDGDFQVKCIDSYSDYQLDNIKIFFDRDNSRKTFEIVMYADNRELCDELFKASRKKLSVQDFMLSAKSEVALAILDQPKPVVVPDYIAEAIKWISA